MPLQLPPRPRRQLAVPHLRQPDDVSCGPTCLHQVYLYYGLASSLDDLLGRVRRNPDGGTLAVYLGLDALSQGLRARLYPLGVRVMDPTWRELGRAELRDRLARRAAAVRTAALREEHLALVEFLDRGGQIQHEELSPGLLVRILNKDRPIVCGLSATYLYRKMRERPSDLEDDDIYGESVGHFVVVCGYTGNGIHFHVRDPSLDVPFSLSGRYVVGGQRLMNAILLGESTRDAVLLEIYPRRAPLEAL